MEHALHLVKDGDNFVEPFLERFFQTDLPVNLMGAALTANSV